MASAQANVRISWRGIGAVAMLLAGALLYGCGGGNAAPTPTAGAIPAQIAPVVSAVAPAETRVATVVAPIETRVATVFDPIVATLEARVGGVRPAQGACPADHPVKGRLDLVPPRREYWAPGSTGYEQAMATICFVTEADAQKALYRQAVP